MLSSIFSYYGDLQAALQSSNKSAGKTRRDGRIAYVDIIGVLSRSGEDGTSTDSVAREIKTLALDDDIACIVLFVSSPGGRVQGTRELADAIGAAAIAKPVFAFVQDMATSAAYWVASQATKVYCEPMAAIGGMGSYMVIADTSGLANKLGVKVHVIRAGKFKGAGVPGSEVTDEQLIECQRVVSAMNEHFIAGVAAGRKLSIAHVQALADGRVHVGAAALALKLVDGVCSYDAFAQAITANYSDRRSVDPTSQFSEAIKLQMSSRNLSRSEAVAYVAMTDPALHASFILATNPRRV